MSNCFITTYIEIKIDSEEGHEQVGIAMKKANDWAK